MCVSAEPQGYGNDFILGETFSIVSPKAANITVHVCRRQVVNCSFNHPLANTLFLFPAGHNSTHAFLWSCVMLCIIIISLHSVHLCAFGFSHRYLNEAEPEAEKPSE